VVLKDLNHLISEDGHEPVKVVGHRCRIELSPNGSDR
jgi:hypothetical protein